MVNNVMEIIECDALGQRQTYARVGFFVGNVVGSLVGSTVGVESVGCKYVPIAASRPR